MGSIKRLKQNTNRGTSSFGAGLSSLHMTSRVLENVTSSSDPSKRALILVVERNPVVQQLERFLLEQAGFSVEFAGDGLMALARARELRPGIVVTEILVPKLDGLRLCRALKDDPQTSSIIVLVFSHLHAEVRAREAGADAFLCKPIDEQRLVGAVAKLLKIHCRGGENNLDLGTFENRE